MPAPDDLRDAGSALWASIVAELGTDWRFDAREVAILIAACRQADAVADLEAAVDRDGVMIPGAQGQMRLNAAVTELRQGRIALARLLGDVALPDEDDEPGTVASQRARRAAQARWSKTLTNNGRAKRLMGVTEGPRRIHRPEERPPKSARVAAVAQRLPGEHRPTGSDRRAAGQGAVRGRVVVDRRRCGLPRPRGAVPSMLVVNRSNG